MATTITPYHINTFRYRRRKDPLGKWTVSNTDGGGILIDNVIQGSSLPGFADRIRKGSDASTYYLRKELKVTKGGLILMQSSGDNYWEEVRTLIGPSPLPSLLPNVTATQQISNAGNRLNNKLREFSGQSNQLTNLVELRELPKTIKGAAESAIGLLSVVSDSKRRGADLKKYASDAWLNWSFGISPTLGAIDDMLASVDKFRNETHTTRDYGISATDWTSSVSSTTSGSLGFNVAIRGTFVHQYSCKVTAAWNTRFASGNNYTMAKHLGFDISSVIPTAWELLPYSWLIDYFTTAGSFLEDNFQAPMGFSKYICQNTLLRVKGVYYYTPINISGYKLEHFSSVPQEIEYFEFTRTPLSQIPRASLRFKTKNEVASNAVNKLLNLSSILGSKS